MAPWACRSRSQRRPTPPHRTSITILGSTLQLKALSELADRSHRNDQASPVPRSQPALDLIRTQPAPDAGCAMASLSSGGRSQHAHMITGILPTELLPVARDCCGSSRLASQSQRLSNDDKVAVIAAPVPMEVARAGDQHQAVRTGLLERLAPRRECLLVNLLDGSDSISEPM